MAIVIRTARRLTSGRYLFEAWLDNSKTVRGTDGHLIPDPDWLYREEWPAYDLEMGIGKPEYEYYIQDKFKEMARAKRDARLIGGIHGCSQ